MTHQEFEERLDEILETALNDFYDYITEKDIIKVADEYSNKTIPKKAKQAIDRLFLDVVGYEPYPDEAKSVTYDLMVRSSLRAELRTTITGKEGGDE